MENNTNLVNPNQLFPTNNEVDNPAKTSMGNKFIKLLFYFSGAVLFMVIGAFIYYLYLENNVKNIQQITNRNYIPSPTITINNQITTEPTQTNDLESAKNTLLTYFTLLNDKKYSVAVQYHGSGFEYIQNWNPDIDKNDYPKLLEMGCIKNGLQCLEISKVLSEKIVSPTEFLFEVQFANDNGTLFMQKQCCGATEQQMPTKDSFEFTVKKINGNFIITTQPVYIP